MLAEIEKMSVPERLQLQEEIWDSLATVPDQVPVTAAQREELARRLEAYHRNPEEGVPWEDVKARMRRA